ncbi:MAG TPA: alcohol dehydrogenase catalytic domain-containing protein [Opitutaceae bacterium]|nr:alcohol dehydrogenase catalytic domain-containing protein [Opitutaceae bacterium]
MRALAKIEPVPGLKLIEALVPTPGPGDVLIRVKKTALSAAAAHIDRWDAWAQRHVRPPLIVGHEFAGLVAEVGPGVTDFHPGELVIGEPCIACGNCRHCLGGRRHLCSGARRLGQDRDGAFADYVCLPQSAVWHADPRLPTDLLACFVPLAQAVRIARRFDLLGAHVLIAGAGPTGGMAVAIAKHSGARSIVVADANPAALTLAHTLGATRTVDTREATLDQVRRELAIADGFDLAIETSGQSPALADLIAHTRLGGQLALLGLPADDALVPWYTIQSKQLTLHGIDSRDNAPDWERLTLAIHSGLDVTPVITHCVPFGRFREAFDRAASGEPGKIIIDWDA